MKRLKVLLSILLIKSIEGKFFDFKTLERNLAQYNSTLLSLTNGKVLEYHSEKFYFTSPLVESSNFTSKFYISKRSVDTKFRGKPKTKQEVWAKNFNLDTQEYSQGTSLVTLLTKIVTKYLGACIPVIIYDNLVEQGEGFILQRLFKIFPTTFIHGKVDKDYILRNKLLLEPPDSKCRSYILFITDALKTRKVIGSQIDNKVIVVPRSTQWKLQEFLSSPLSRDIINLLVIGESYTADKTKDRPYVLYTHKLFVDGLGSNRPKLLTSWMNEKLSRPHIDLFPSKLNKGFAGHRFSIGAADFPPFVVKKLSTDGAGNIQIKWDGYEYRLMETLSKKLNFSFDMIEPSELAFYGPGDAIAESIKKERFDIGLAGMYVTTERNIKMEMSIAHSTDCAAFVTMTSKALPRYRAILGPFQWPVWLALTLVYLVAIFPLAYSDSLSLKYLINNPAQIENMFWYVFGTFTNSLTFTGEKSWSNSKKTSTRLLIGFYWVFTIIITACYTGSIIAFVTLPTFPETIDTISQLNQRFYRVGTLDRGGWERWFLNSTDKDTEKLIKRLELVRNIEEGLSNVTKPFFLFPYSFIGSKAQLEYVIQTNYTNEKLGRRSVLHVSDQCFVLFGVGIALQPNSVYRDKINNGIMALQQSGLMEKIKRDVRWDLYRTPAGGFLQISAGKTLVIRSQEERGLTLADTEGMFLLLAIGFLIAAGALVSEWVGGCTNKCIRMVKSKREDDLQHARERDRLDHEEMMAQRDNAAVFEVSAAVDIKISRAECESMSSEGEDEENSKSETSLIVGDLSPSMLYEMYKGPKGDLSNVVMFNGKLMTECEAGKLSCEMEHERQRQRERELDADELKVSETFDFLNSQNDEDSTSNDNEDEETDDMKRKPQSFKVEINAATPIQCDNEQGGEEEDKKNIKDEIDEEEMFVEKVDITG